MPEGIISLESIKLKKDKTPEFSGCGSKGGSGKSSCGSSKGPSDLAPEIWEKIKDHPCYSEEAHHHFARMHVAVAPACNIQCNYCNRKYDCANESRPGVVSERLTPEAAAHKVAIVAAKVPQMSVLGIAGPGDPLANPAKTFQTFELVAQMTPDIKLCLSTNGLMLPEYVDIIKRYNIDHVTITINMVDPQVGELIYPWIYFKNKRYRGREAAKILSERQLEGLDRLSEEKILCKVNSVMIPGINDEHLVEVNRVVKSKGAFLHNIMPLISEPEHGTYFGLNGQRGPTAKELKVLQDKCAGEMNMMRHCRQCRADAVGLLGEDRSKEFSQQNLEAMSISDEDQETRRVYREFVEVERAAKLKAREEELATVQDLQETAPILLAVATKGGGRINEHFGHAKEFQVYEASANGVHFVGHRRVDLYCQGGYGEEDALDTVIKALADCHAVFIAKIGSCPKETLEKAGIETVDTYAFEYIDKALLAYFKDYAEKLQSGVVKAGTQKDALIRQGAYSA